MSMSVEPMSTVPATPTYYFPNVPLLSAAIVVCCAQRDDAELEMFWKHYDDFTKRFNLDAEQAGIMWAPSYNPKPPQKPIPTLQQLDATAHALQDELRAAKPMTSQLPLPKPFDPALSKNFPVLIELYDFFALGSGKLRPSWEQDLVKELRDFRTIIEW